MQSNTFNSYTALKYSEQLANQQLLYLARQYQTYTSVTHRYYFITINFSNDNVSSQHIFAVSGLEAAIKHRSIGKQIQTVCSKTRLSIS